jgi:pblB|nr:MAG TPA: minor structural protein [Caudoviricetes sp.]
MDIEINNNKQQASFRNGKFYHTFTPTTANQTVKLYHIGCVGDTRLNRIQLEQGTEPTGFVVPKQTTNTLSGIFKNLRDLDVKMTDPDSDFWTRIKKTARGTVEEYHTNTIKNEIVKTAEGIIEKQTKVINTSVENKIIAETKKYSDELSSRITTLSNNALRKDEISITTNGVTLGSGKVVDGRTISSILTTQPENIKAITDKFIITPANENLVKREYRDNLILNVRNSILNRIYGSNTDLVGEYHFKVSIMEFDPPTLYASIHVKYKDGTEDWFNSEFPTASWGTFETSTSVKVQVESGKEIEYIEPLVFQNKWSNFYRFQLKNLFVGKKKSAELIVDGSIEGRHIKSTSLETGHFKAGSVTSDIIAANAVRAKHVLIDDGLINNLVTHNAFISKLWAQDAFIKYLKTVKISATQLDTDWLSAYTGEIGGFRIGHNPNDNDFWLTGANNFECGINPGLNAGTRGAQIWAAWGRKWTEPGPNAWRVNAQGVMICNNRAVFNRGFDVHGAGIYTHDQDITSQGAGSSTTNVMWWSQIYRVKSAISDKRLKINVKPTKVKALDMLNNIEMVEFNWKKDGKFEKIGAIAQQVQSVEASLVVHDMDDKQTYNDYLRINYYDTIPYLIKAVQELSQQNKELQNKLEEIING